MGRSAASIQAEITLKEAWLASQASLYTSVGADGTSVSNADIAKVQERLDSLYIQLDRANGTSPMLVRGRLKGL